MPNQLRISIGQHSNKGRKNVNQDFHGAYTPQAPLLTSKGIAIALADGISSSEVSQVASEAAVTGFLEDYYCTSDAWSVLKSAQRVLNAINSWLHSQTQRSPYRYEKDKGYVCAFSAMVMKSATAHIFHVGDARIYQLRGDMLEQLTIDHRHWVSEDKSYLGRALGINQFVEIDCKVLALKKGDVYIFATDGVYEYASTDFMIKAINEYGYDLNIAAQAIAEEAYMQNSTDNLTIQIVKVDDLPSEDVAKFYQEHSELPFPPILEARMKFEGYSIVREISASSRSHVYLAVDDETQEQVIIKTPSIDLRDSPAYIERLLMEEWIARRINSAYVLKPCIQSRQRNYLYIVTEYIEGQTLAQWMVDNPAPDMTTVRRIVEQIARGLLAFHRQEMLHQDLRPANIMIDSTGTVRIIDFGSVRVAGISDMAGSPRQQELLGTPQYTAAEYFLGEAGTERSDQFSLGVIAYQMLTGRLPYGAQLAKCKTLASQRKLKYNTLLDDEREIPAWVDDVIKKSVHPNPFKRYQELSEFVFDLSQPNKEFLNKVRPPMMERNPVLFWKGTSFILAVMVVILLAR
jgi:serine/threonine protein phosphatase PrpC/predicted Ser/Thr protein kinase